MKLDTVVNRVRQLAKAETEAWCKAGDASFTDNKRRDAEGLFEAACSSTDEFVAFVTSIVSRSICDPEEVTVNALGKPNPLPADKLV